MICSNCKTKNLDGASKCKKCGKSFKNDNDTNSNVVMQGKKEANERISFVMTCYKCNKDIPGDKDYCPHCGYPVSESLRLYGKKRRTFLFCGIMVIACILSILLYINSAKESSSEIGLLLLAFALPGLILFFIGIFMIPILISFVSYSEDSKYSKELFEEKNSHTINNGQNKIEIPVNTYKGKKEVILNCYHCKKNVSSKENLCKNCRFPVIKSIQLHKSSDIAVIFSLLDLTALIVWLVRVMGRVNYYYDIIRSISGGASFILTIVVIFLWISYFNKRTNALVLYKRIKIDEKILNKERK